jgi:hypothetical protein
MTQSKELKRFYDSVAAGGRQKSVTYPLDLFAVLDPAERRKAEDRLIDLARRGDVQAVETLSAAGVTRALAVLERLTKASNDLGSAAARAVLELMGPDPATVARVAEGVKTDSLIHSAFSAFALRSAEGDDATMGLLDALLHPFSPTRANAILGLTDKLRLEPLITPRQSPLWVLMQDAHMDFPSIWEPAARRLRKVLEGLLAGRTPQELGLVYVRASREADIDEVWTPNDYGFDLDALFSLRGHDLAWATSYIIGRLEVRDDRAPEALVALGATEALPALRACLPRAEARKVGSVYTAAIKALEAQAAAIGDA